MSSSVKAKTINIRSKPRGEDVRTNIADAIDIMDDRLDGAIDNQVLVLDSTLTQNGQGADAKIAGGMFHAVSSDISMSDKTINYNYDKPYTTSETSGHVGIERYLDVVRLTKNRTYGYNIYVRLNDDAVIAYTGSEIDSWANGLTGLIAGHKYCVTVYYPVSNYELETLPTCSVYKQGTHSSVGTYIRATDAFRRFFIAEEEEEYFLALYIPNNENTYDSTQFRVTLIDLTKELESEDAVDISYIFNKSNADHNSVHFSWDSTKTVLTMSKISDSDPQTMAAKYELYRVNPYYSNMPAELVKGKTYYIDTQINDPNVSLEFIFYRGESHEETVFRFREPGFFTVPVDNDSGNITGLIIRFWIQPNTITDQNTVIVNKCVLYTAATNKGLVDCIVSAPKRIRIMQYNAGMFAMGSKVPSQRIPSDLIDEKIKNYRKMLCETNVDVVAIQEYSQYMDADGLKDTENTLFAPLFNSRFLSIPTERAVFCRYRQTYAGASYINVPWSGRDDPPPEGYTYNRYYTLSRYMVAPEKEITIMNIALYPPIGTNAMTEREHELEYLMDLLKNEKYPFILLDMNNGGTQRSDGTFVDGVEVTSEEEGRALCAIAKAKGWNFAMGSYYPWERTFHKLPSSDWGPKIDNIIYKNDGSVTFRNFVICNDIYIDSQDQPDHKLYSDHYPVYGEFELN